ncbi:hypothetical protein [Nocardia alba]|uniref:Uncharacterized protein n=1 Tax=Nocardia alba TaxID=225051 RepID=A0A4R1FP16_9NOCA|nr:hypothetical protein [Nocardia alba]TCJ95232.1 hypothetical protein DFR71_4147 [Nocardia alba]
MISTTPRRAAGLALMLTGAALGLTGCGGNSGYQTQPPQPTEPTISQASVRELCGILDGQKGTWKALGPQVARVAFTGAIRLWTVNDTVANAAIAYNRHIVDTVTIQTCPRVRDATLASLEVPDIEVALGGF